MDIMSSEIPIIKQIAWLSILPQFAVMGLIIWAWYLINPERGVLYGALTYLALSFFLRNALTKAHRIGMIKVRQEKYKSAIPEFQQSYSFFKKYPWIDQYRYLTILSSTKISYSEMALVNIAFCYGQLGDQKNCLAYYRRTLQEFPNSGIAKAALNMLEANEKKSN